ncbi:hypothetical protein [Jiangella muralis]|uniref:hypothetical protein n=1 Tax=Jiangella muralis TaxID=702383 RepID=UPI00069D58AD|nr:hypothetical protein [Jiangella muralis]
MTAAADYQHLHELIDRLTPRQVRHLRALAQDLVEAPAAGRERRPGDSGAQGLSFAGIGESGRGDLAENADRYLDEGFGKD